MNVFPANHEQAAAQRGDRLGRLEAFKLDGQPLAVRANLLHVQQASGSIAPFDEDLVEVFKPFDEIGQRGEEGFTPNPPGPENLPDGDKRARL